MKSPVTFFSRCRPQGVDAIEIVLESNRIFIGYPMARPGEDYNPRRLRACVVDPSCDEAEWTLYHSMADHARRRQYSQNRNLIRRVTVGSIAMIPRPSSGVVYCGLVKGEFELVDTPSWYDRYMQIRGDTDGPSTWHAGDICQCWELDALTPVAYSRIPVWIRRSLFGRSTYGVVPPNELGGDPHKALSGIIANQATFARDWTLDLGVIEKRLLEDLSPSSFEHLVVSLLQLEHPHEIWSHVGGSGDGGVDGIASSEDGNLVALLQCKWQYDGGQVFIEASSSESGLKRRYLASLQYPGEGAPKRADVVFLGRKRIAELVAKHHARLPEALSMRIGK
jgi:hypothetical protein